MRPKRFWREMTHRDFAHDTQEWIAVLPLAAIEQHGPHLPLGVDAMIAEGLVKQAAQKLPYDLPITFLPVQEICKSNEHNSFAGTLSLDWDLVIRTWIGIGQSVARAGLRTLIIITSHGGNTAPMEIAARELRLAHGMQVVTTSWGRLGDWEHIYPQGPGPMIDVHAGLAETSLMLALRPDLVNMSAAQDFPSAQTDLAMASAKLGYHGAAGNLAWLAEDLNPQGAVGNAKAASADLGQADIDSTVAGLAELVYDLIAHGEETKG